jgi:hypothetical protein
MEALRNGVNERLTTARKRFADIRKQDISWQD